MTETERAQFDAQVERVLRELPEWVLRAFDNISIMIEDDPSPDLDPEGQGLLGLYTGIPLPERGIHYAGALPDVIHIFRNPHLALGLSESETREEIARTVMHEIAHYFGIDDDYLERNGWG